MQPKLITFEGVDGSGKSTQATMLFHRLLKQGYNALLVREPGGTTISEKIRDVLLDIRHEKMAPETELLLYAASRAQLVYEKIKPQLEEGGIVICDRYTDSTLAYQGYGRGLNQAFIRNLNALATGELEPYLTYIIDVAIQVAEHRAAHTEEAEDRLESEHRSFKERVRNGYRRIAEEEPSRVVLLNGGQAIETIHERIWELTIQHLEANTELES